MFGFLATKNCNPFEHPVSRKIFKIYFFLITAITGVIYAIDFEHYDYLHQRLNASVFNYAEDAKISMNMVWRNLPCFYFIDPGYYQYDIIICINKLAV